MKVIHLCPSGPFNEFMSYHENILAKLMVTLGFEVTLITSRYDFLDGEVVRVDKIDKLTEDNYRLIRLDYFLGFAKTTATKIRRLIGLTNLLEEIKPDLVWFHGIQSVDLLNIAKYKKKYPKTIIIADSHADKYNSGLKFFSRTFLHRILYKNIILRSISSIDKLIAISLDSQQFLIDHYGIKPNIIEIFPLGGEVLQDEISLKFRKKIRSELGVSENEIVYLHTGKLDQKKLTLELISAFKKAKSNKSNLYIIGSIGNDIKDTFFNSISNENRIYYLGWKNYPELKEYLHACDVYIQPGGQSATMQQAACCGCAVALQENSSHKYIFGKSAFYINSENEIIDLITSLESNRNKLFTMKSNVFKHAKEKLNYISQLEQIMNDLSHY